MAVNVPQPLNGFLVDLEIELQVIKKLRDGYSFRETTGVSSAVQFGMPLSEHCLSVGVVDALAALPDLAAVRIILNVPNAQFLLGAIWLFLFGPKDSAKLRFAGHQC